MMPALPLNHAHIPLFEFFKKKSAVFVRAGLVWEVAACCRRRVGVIDVCRQQTAEWLSEGLWACSPPYEEIKSVKCQGSIKAGEASVGVPSASPSPR